jgi:HPt (histidine-containing phosphotransfer) domain-containing protein
MSEDINKNSMDVEIDLSYLNEIASGSADFMIDMIDIFLEQTPEYLGQLSEAISAKDWKATGDIAHKIKPTLAFMGVEYAREVMAEIERKARSLDALDTIEEDMQYINGISSNLYSRLNQHRKELEAQL